MSNSPGWYRRRHPSAQPARSCAALGRQASGPSPSMPPTSRLAWPTGSVSTSPPGVRRRLPHAEDGSSHTRYYGDSLHTVYISPVAGLRQPAITWSVAAPLSVACFARPQAGRVGWTMLSFRRQWAGGQRTRRRTTDVLGCHVAQEAVPGVENFTKCLDSVRLALP